MANPSTTPQKPSIVTAPLFSKILTGILIPMMILLAVLAFMTLVREISVEVNRCWQQTDVLLKSVNEEFLKLFTESDTPPAQQSKAELQYRTDFLKNIFGLEKVDLLNPAKLVSLMDDSSPENTSDPILQGEFEGLPDSIAAKRRGQPYYISADVKWTSKSQAIFGYIPFKHKSATDPLVLVTVYRTSFAEVSKRVARQVFFMFLAALGSGILIAMRLSYKIVRPITVINKGCQQILNGKLGLQVNVKTGDEIEMLAKNFNQMSRALYIKQKMAKDSNPLTNLPGNEWIMAELNRRLKEKVPFVYFHIDIDRFKAYNDHYGLGKGDFVLRRTSEVLRACLKEVGTKQNFLGHQGGDDFVIIAAKDTAEILGKAVCKHFDESLKEFYEEAVLSQGYFMGEESRPEFGEEAGIKKHGLMAISLAGISVSHQNPIPVSAEDVLKSAIRVKKKAKKIAYSKYLIEECIPE